MTELRIPAEVFPLAYYLQDEMNARYWTAYDVARRMGGETAEAMGLDLLLVNLTLYVHDPNLLLDQETADKFARAFGVASEFFMNLDRAYREWCGAAAGISEGGKGYRYHRSMGRERR